MTKVANGAPRTRQRRTGLALATASLVMVVSACTSGAPVAPPQADSPSTAASGQLFPLVRDAPSDGATVRRVGFVDGSGRVVVRPTYRAWLACPAADGTDVVLAWGGGPLDRVDTDGTTTSASALTDVTTVTCGPLPGHVTVGTSTATSVVTVPDLTPSDLPAGVALDASVVFVPATGQGGRQATAPYLYDAATSTRTTLPGEVASLVAPGQTAGGLSTGEWPVPVLDTKGKQRYLDRTGSWVTTQTFAQAGGFVHGHGWVSTGRSWRFVDPRLTPVGRDWTSIVPWFTTDGGRLTPVGYQVTSAAGKTNTGLVTVDLDVVVDPDTESATCTTTGRAGSTACVASAADGTARLVVLPEGTSTPLPEGMTTALSDRLVTDATGSQVYNLTTGQTFAVPTPYHAEAAWGDAYVVTTSDNGLRVVLDGTGQPTSLGTITGQVVADDGTAYFWATTADQQGYVDAAGDWLYDEARHTVLED